MLAYSFGQINSVDVAFRGVMLLLATHPQYQLLPFRQINTFFNSIQMGRYLLVIKEEQIIGAILWAEISNLVRDTCISQNRGPFLSELETGSDAIYCIGFVALESAALRPLWKNFVQRNKNRDILYKRHFSKKGKPKPIALIRDAKVLSSK